MRLRTAVALVIAALWLQSAHADERDFSGTVTKIFDGDSFLVRPQRGREIDVRLIDIDAPEKLQPHGEQARAALQKLIGSRAVFVDVVDDDQYGRKLARVYREPDRLDVARTLVRDGHVWVYRRTVRDRSLIPLEDAARAAHAGLWARPDEDRVPPWRYRYLERQNKNGITTKNTKNTKDTSTTKE
jgi:endonuclease YncB( thermonuclease family)